MSNLLVKPSKPDSGGRIHAITPASAGWTYVGFEVYQLKAGQSLERATGDREACIVMLSGKARVAAGGEDFGVIGGRSSPFESDPWSLYAPVEVITPSGHWSSYPPHKHDRDALPNESLLEETYYHRLNPPSGFALQRVYTDDRSLDETLAASDRDVVLVPRGYHPVGAPHGYELYYLNVMAGPKRVWKFHNDPAHEWMMA
jgi:5-deoxy-D-glucuronate isomerase